MTRLQWLNPVLNRPEHDFGTGQSTPLSQAIYAFFVETASLSLNDFTRVKVSPGPRILKQSVELFAHATVWDCRLKGRSLAGIGTWLVTVGLHAAWHINHLTILSIE